MDERFAGQVAIVSGGAGDIGRAIALELARAGATVAVADVSGERVESVARFDVVDVTDAAAVRAWVAAVEADLGLPTIIVAAAAITSVAGVLEITPQAWSAELRTNLDGVFHVAQAGALRLRAHDSGGRIVLIGSPAAHAPHTHIPAYSVAKAGLRMLCQVMAMELAPHGIVVNEVAPGFVNAGLSGRAFDADPALRERAIDRVPIGRLVEPEEVAWTVAQLCDPRNVHMTGSLVLIDGGLSLINYSTDVV